MRISVNLKMGLVCSLKQWLLAKADKEGLRRGQTLHRDGSVSGIRTEAPLID